MKKYLTGIVAVLLAISFSAFTHHSPKRSESTTDFTWAKTDLNGDIPSNPELFEGTSSEAEEHFSCPDGSTYICAKAVDENNDPLPGVPPVMRGL